MRIGILNLVESKSPEMRARFGGYANVFRENILGNEFESVRFDAIFNELPKSVGEFDGYLISGADDAVYDPLHWIKPLEDFIRAAIDRKIPTVGICFGHQLIAHALGGRVEKSPNGFGLGLHAYNVSNAQRWMDGVSSVSLMAFHEDQVIVLPPHADVILSSAFTPFAGLAYTRAPVLSFQAHPEFSPAYVDALLHLPNLPKFPQALLDKALASLNKPNDSTQVISWIRRFFKHFSGEKSQDA
ncbi:MAG: gamma-glutamyl-gamma-aminobutyrate hydrolase family protein [Bdellovibrionales bacterium]